MNGETNVEQIQIIDSNKHVGETVKIGAWIANKRSSGKIATVVEMNRMSKLSFSVGRASRWTTTITSLAIDFFPPYL